VDERGRTVEHLLGCFCSRRLPVFCRLAALSIEHPLGAPAFLCLVVATASVWLVAVLLDVSVIFAAWLLLKYYNEPLREYLTLPRDH
jgi:hypothetical protein